MFGFGGNKSFVKITKRPSQQQKVKTIVQEHYLRDDIACGSALCPKCRALSEDRSQTLSGHDNNDEQDLLTYFVVDTNVILHQMDLLNVRPENGGLINLIIPTTTLQEVQARSAKSYQKLREMIADERRHYYVFVNEHCRDTFVERLPNESPNDRNDRAIRVTAKWYQDHLAAVPNLRVLLLTNDRDNRLKAEQMNIKAMTVYDYVNSLNVPELIDTLATTSAAEVKDDSAVIYSEYITDEAIKEGLKTGKYYQGPLRQNLDNWLEAIVQTNASPQNHASIEGEDILIKGRINMNRAIDGDIVVAELFPKEQWEEPSSIFIDEDAPNVDSVEESILALGGGSAGSTSSEHRKPTGRVVAVIRKSWRPYCGTLEPTEYKSVQGPFYLFVPLNRRVPKIKIRTRQPERLLNQRIMVCIDEWNVRSKYPVGHYVRTIGPVGEKKVESEAILRQHDIRIEPFTAAVRADLPPEDVAIVPQQGRLDLRGEAICSIDPPGCTDIDDALHVKVLPNGNLQVGVHIADVSHYVKEGTAIDKEARERGNTVYLVERRIDMLPELLGTNLCSLNQHVDRYAFSCLWEMTPEAEIINTSFHKTLIRSRKSFSYGQAQACMDDPALNDELTVGIRTLNKLAKILKQRRLDAGALTLASSEVRFIKDEETHDPIDLELYESKETNSLVEEFMLLANISVAKQITKFYPAFALLRRHPEPRYDAFEVLSATLKKRFGVELDVSSSKRLSETLDAACNKTDDDFFKRLLRMMVTRCMNQARYFSSGSTTPAGFRHYGLAADIYTHFTSPIRRYADVIVHRLLASSIGYQPLTPHLNHHDVGRTCDVINRRHRTAELAGRDSTRFHTLEFFKQKNLEPEPAYVMNCAENGFTILVPRYGLEGKVYICAPGTKSNWGWRAADRSLVAPDGKKTLTSLDRVVVKMQIDHSKPWEPRIVFSSVDPPAGPNALDARIGHALPLEAPSDLKVSQSDQDESETEAKNKNNKNKKRKSDAEPAGAARTKIAKKE